jgi:hypothetical protein
VRRLHTPGRTNEQIEDRRTANDERVARRWQGRHFTLRRSAEDQVRVMSTDITSDAPALSFEQLAALPATVDVVTAGRALGIGRTTAYSLVRTGQFPCPVIRVRGTYRVPTLGILRLLGLDPARPHDQVSD